MTDADLQDEEDWLLIQARARHFREVRRTCGHDWLKGVGAYLWECQLCGLIQDERQPGGLKQPGTRARRPTSVAIGVELLAWESPGTPKSSQP